MRGTTVGWRHQKEWRIDRWSHTSFARWSAVGVMIVTKRDWFLSLRLTGKYKSPAHKVFLSRRYSISGCSFLQIVPMNKDSSVTVFGPCEMAIIESDRSIDRDRFLVLYLHHIFFNSMEVVREIAL